jgi:hypothetical protein
MEASLTMRKNSNLKKQNPNKFQKFNDQIQNSLLFDIYGLEFI